MQRHVAAAGVLLALFFASARSAPAQSSPAPASSQGALAANVNRSEVRDGWQDFDFNAGTWTTHISRLLHPLSGSNTWVHLTGTVDIQKVWGGKAQIEQIEANGLSGHFERLTLYLYNPDAHQWNIHFANSRDG